jgi:hypothetical protein
MSTGMILLIVLILLLVARFPRGHIAETGVMDLPVDLVWC